MKTETFSIAGPVLFTPRLFRDGRGFFAEIFKANAFAAATGSHDLFVQDNLSVSAQAGTIRGLHFQAPPHAQGKLVSCQQGRILDVIIDARKSSATYGQHLSIELSAQTRAQLWVPPNFLHGYVTREDNCEVAYKVTDYYAPESEGSVIWNDPDLAVNWGVSSPIISERDRAGQSFSDFMSPFA
ncbi:MAG: dTDP-4-dehydrorhamnose 3,5-epimerase [Hellea sp.]